MKSNKTRERILDASLELFNEKKASNVSTVQISAAMKISPGNLYYYYANKEEVIRCIWLERMTGRIDELLKTIEKMETAEDLLECMEDCFRHFVDYKFFYTELPTLFINDNQLIDMYRSVESEVKLSLTKAYEKWNREGMMIDISDEERIIISENMLALAHKFISNYDVAELYGRDFSDFMNCVWIRMVSFLNPYFTEPMKAEILKAFENRKITYSDYFNTRNGIKQTIL